MQLKSKKAMSKLLTLMMLFTIAFSSTGDLNAFASDTSTNRKIDVWDFGGIQTSGDVYNNNITADVLDSKTTIKSGTFVTTPFGDLTIANPATTDRMYYYESDGTTPGINSYGTWGSQKHSYDDGYTANGVYYANGTGGSGRRFLTLNNVVAGDKITVYGGTSNGNETIHLVHAAVIVSGTTVTVTPDTSQVQDSYANYTTSAQKVDFTAKYSGSYQIYVTAGAGGKPYFQRVMRIPGVKVSGTVNLNGSDIAAGYALHFTNQTTGDTTTVNVNADNTFNAVLTAGYDYIATFKDIANYRISDETKIVSTSTSDFTAGKNVSLDVVPNKLVTISGNMKGFDSSYDLSKLQITFTPPVGSLTSPITATVNTNAKTFTANVQDGVQYAAVISGVNDYEIVEGGSIHISVDTTQDITVAKKAVHTATGKFQGLSSTAQISSITFTNVDDGYIYTGTVSNGGYTVSLRDGAYSVTAVCSENYSTSSHVVINGQDSAKDIMFDNNTAPEPLGWVPDLYVGDSSKTNNFSTVKDALAAAARMNPTDEAHRITIHIAPGVYRAQLVIKTPYITLVNSNPNPTSDPSTQVKITWYYGIGYKYYSMGPDGFYNADNAFDKYSKNIASKWGGTVYLTSTATYFKAKNIVFENSFNKYMTDEELADGVELAHVAGSTINVDRKSFTDVTSRAATERAAAMIIEGNHAEFEGCSFLGSQDTLYTGGSGTNSSYFKNSFIEGNTDYIYGDGNVVFDNATLNFAGYSDQAVGGYITAATDKAAYGYLFRDATVTAGSKNMQKSGFFGRPWGVGARVTFLNTKLQSSTIIDPKGWTDMSGPPENAHFAEYNTTYNGTAVDTSQRRAPVLTDAQAAAINVANYFGGWTPSSYTAGSDTAPTFKIAPFFTTDDDINIPYTGNTISLGYEFDHANDNLNDSSLIQWYRVSPDGIETLINTTTAYVSKTYKIASADAGYYIKAVVTPETVDGLKGTPMSVKLDNLVRVGSSGPGGVNGIPDGQRVNIYIAGDSTVKTYGSTIDTGGWGEYLQSFFNSDKVNIVNYANGGRSSRSFINEGSLDKIASTIKAGDYLLVQFGHNDEANQSQYLIDRFVSMGEPDANGIYPSTPGVKEATPSTLLSQYGAEYYPYTTGTFKWYLQQYIDVARKAGATPILVTAVSRQYFNRDGTIRPHHDATDTTTGTITTSNNAYVRAAEQLGEEQGVKVIDMFDLTKDSFEKAYKNDPAASNGSSPLARAIMNTADSTHNNKIGGFYNGALMAEEIQGLGYNISNYVIPPVRVGGVDSKNSVEFEVDSHSKVSVYSPDTRGVYTSQLNTYWTGETQALIDRISAPSVQPTITITPSTAAFDKNPANQADVAVTLQTGAGINLTSITNGSYTLNPATDYSVNGNVVTINKSYMVQLSVGTATLQFKFSSGDSLPLAAAISNTTPLPSQTIAAVPPLTLYAIAGVAPYLPTVVPVNYTDQTTAAVSVIWSSVDSSQYAAPGNFTVQGTVYGTTIPAVATINVQSPDAVGAVTGGPDLQSYVTNLPFSMPALTEPQFANSDFNIKDYGAVGDGVAKNTASFANAIAAANQGGGRVVVPAGVWLTGPIQLKSNVNLHLEQGAEIRFSTDYGDYGDGSGKYKSMLSVTGVTNVAITGSGMINGNGQAWRYVKKYKLTDSQWNYFLSLGGVVTSGSEGLMWYPNQQQLAKDNRPVMLDVSGSKNVLIDGLTLTNSPQFAGSFHGGSQNLIIRNTTVNNDWWAQNGDGLDVTSSQNVVLYHNTVNAGDDGIAVKSSGDPSPTNVLSNVIIANNIVFRAHGGFVVGSNTTGGIQNVAVRNNQYIGTDFGIKIKSYVGGGGPVQNLYIDGIHMQNIVNEAISFDTYYKGHDAASDNAQPGDYRVPEYKNIHISNVTADGASQAVAIDALPHIPMHDVDLNNVTIKADSGWVSTNATGFQLNNVQIIPSSGTVVTLNNSTNFMFNHVLVPDGTDTFLHLEGSSSGIQLTSTDYSPAKTPFVWDQGINHDVITVTGPGSLTTTAAFSPAEPDGQNGWYVHPVTVSLSAADAFSAVAGTEYSLDGGTTWQPYTSAITFDKEGKYTLSYRSTDNAGIVEAVKTATINLDSTAPATTASVSPAEPDGQNSWYVHPVTVTLSAADNLSGVAKTEYSLDGGSTWQGYTNPVTLSQDGKYTVSYRSTDNASNAEEVKTIGFNLDSTAPTIAVSGLVYGTYSDSMDITPTLTISDNLSGVDGSKTTVTLDTYGIQQGASVPLYTLPLGSHTLFVTASDLAGNTGSQTVVFQTTTSIQSMQALVTRFTNMGWIDSSGIANSLQSKLAANALTDFVSEVQAQSGKHISSQAAGYLLRDAQYVLTQK